MVNISILVLSISVTVDNSHWITYMLSLVSTFIISTEYEIVDGSQRNSKSMKFQNYAFKIKKSQPSVKYLVCADNSCNARGMLNNIPGVI